jgi:WXG100 family type VII secretion target
MSGDRRGGSIAEMEQLSRLFAKHARELDAIIKDLNGSTVNSSAIWWGPGADRFRAAWQEAKGSFEQMARALDDGAQDVKRSQQNIEAATR